MSNESEPSPDARWVPALVIDSATRVTPQQRARNIAMYDRLKDGHISPRHGGQEGGLWIFVYDVPIERMKLAPDGKSFSFRLEKDDECFMRLIGTISDYMDGECGADDEVDRLRARVAELERIVGQANGGGSGG